MKLSYCVSFVIVFVLLLVVICEAKVRNPTDRRRVLKAVDAYTDQGRLNGIDSFPGYTRGVKSIRSFSTKDKWNSFSDRGIVHHGSEIGRIISRRDPGSHGKINAVDSFADNQGRLNSIDRIRG
jgi:hypothetical protein